MKILIGNIATEYSDEGEGPVLLMLHGWQDSLHTFDALAPLLAKKFRVVRVDLPGFGSSEMPRGAWALGDYVQFVRAFIDRLQLSVAVLVGHSFGGRIAVKGVATGALQPGTLVLIASAGIAKRNSVRSWLFMALAKAGNIIAYLPPLIFFRTKLRKALYRHAGSDYGHAGELKDTFVNIVQEDLVSAARGIRVPTLLIWGDDDTETPLADGNRFSALIPGSVLRVFLGAGHFVHREQPQAVARYIEEFV